MTLTQHEIETLHRIMPDLKGGHRHTAECLLKGIDPTGGLVSPGIIIAGLESSIEAIDPAVIGSN